MVAWMTCASVVSTGDSGPACSIEKLCSHALASLWRPARLLKICGCRALANNADHYQKVEPLLSMGAFDAESLYDATRRLPWRCGISCRAYTWLLAFATGGQPRDLRWAAVCWLRDVVVPQLKQGLVALLWRAAAEAAEALEPPRRGGRAELAARNAAVERGCASRLRLPDVLRTLVLRDVCVASACDRGGPLFHSAGSCWTERRGAWRCWCGASRRTSGPCGAFTRSCRGARSGRTPSSAGCCRRCGPRPRSTSAASCGSTAGAAASWSACRVARPGRTGRRCAATGCGSRAGRPCRPRSAARARAEKRAFSLSASPPPRSRCQLGRP
ncbi:unnamed protein product [Prorocentrum cordatum]|uniref:Uncharacterized protein n=1 Tax=Prorocentrum cordatum TaxID=2364126 RepID=A0ABN9PDM3_9DINO|nr:unnamed protein product [Polarella glacialis]